MGVMVSQVTSLTIVYSTVYSGTDKKKHQSSTSLAFVRGINRPVNSRRKWPVTRKMYPFDDVIMPLLFPASVYANNKCNIVQVHASTSRLLITHASCAQLILFQDALSIYDDLMQNGNTSNKNIIKLETCSNFKLTIYTTPLYGTFTGHCQNFSRKSMLVIESVLYQEWMEIILGHRDFFAKDHATKIQIRCCN